LNNTKRGTVNKFPKWILVIFISLGTFILLLIVGYFISVPILKKRINKEIQLLEPEIELSYSTVEFQLFPASIRIDSLNILFRPNSHFLKHQHLVHLQWVKLSGINLGALLRGKEFTAESLKLGPGQINLDQLLLDQNQPFPQAMISRLNLSFQKMSVHRIESEKLSVSVDSAKQNLVKMEATLDLHAAEIDDIQDSISLKKMHLGSFKGELTDIRLSISGTLHYLHINSFVFNSEKKTAYIKTLKIIPLCEKLDLGKRLGFQADFVEATIPEIEIVNPDWQGMLNEKIRADKIFIGRTTAYIFRDRRIVRRMEVQSLPGDFLNSLPFDIHVDSVLISPSTMTYEEFPAIGEHTGILKIERMRLSITPLMNHSKIGDPKVLHSRVSGAIMGSGEVTANITMPLKNNEDYLVEGEFNNLELTKLNSAAENLGKLHIESGMLNNLTFQFHFNSEQSSGQVVGEYHDLVIDKLREGQKNMGKTDRFKSFFLQKLIIRRNKDKSLPLSKRTGKIKYKRDATRFVSFYLLQSLLSGVKSSFTLGFLLPH
jgi:hypothetical protein